MSAQQGDAPRRSGPRSSRELVAWTAAPLISAAAATVCYSLRPTFPEWGTWFLVWAIIFAVAAIALQVAKAIVDKRSLDAGTEEANTVRVATTEALQQFIDDLAELPALLPAKQKQFVRTVTEAGAAALYTLLVTRVPRVRVNIFHLEAEGTRLVSRGKAGRGVKAKAFLGSTDEGREALEFVADHKVRLWADLSVEAPKYWTPSSSSGYQTFIAAPIFASEPDGSEYSIYGMVTVDAPTANSLTLVEQHSVTLVADLMAVAFAIAEYSQPGATRV